MMTREQAIADIEQDFASMSEEEKNMTLWQEGDVTVTPKYLLEQIHAGHERGLAFADNWASRKAVEDEMIAALSQMFGISPEEMRQQADQAAAELMSGHTHGPECVHDEDDEDSN